MAIVKTSGWVLPLSIESRVIRKVNGISKENIEATRVNDLFHHDIISIFVDDTMEKNEAIVEDIEKAFKKSRYGIAMVVKGEEFGLDPLDRWAIPVSTWYLIKGVTLKRVGEFGRFSNLPYAIADLANKATFSSIFTGVIYMPTFQDRHQVWDPKPEQDRYLKEWGSYAG